MSFFHLWDFQSSDLDNHKESIDLLLQDYSR